MDARDRLELYRDDGPDPDLPGAEALRRQLSRSESLRRRHNKIIEADSQIEAALYPAAPADFRTHLLAEIAARQAAMRQKRRRTQRWIAASLSAAATILLLVVAWPLWPRDMGIDDLRAESGRIFASRDAITWNPEDWGADATWPVGFEPRFFQGAGTIKVAGHRCRAYLFSADSRQALVLMVPKRVFPTGAEWAGYDFPADDGISLVLLDSGDYVCVVLLEGKKQDLARFTSATPLT